MSEELKNIELFDRYLNNELQGQDLIDFENRLKEDFAFKADFELHKGLSASIQFAGEQDLRTELDGYHKEIKKYPGRKKTGTLLLYFAGTLAILTIVLILWNPLNREKDVDPDSNPKENVVTTDSTSTIDSVATTESTPDSVTTIDTSGTTAELVQDNADAPKVIEQFSKPVLKLNRIKKNTYTFGNGVLNLYGCDFLNLERAQIVRNRQNFYLFDGRVYYPLNESSRKQEFRTDNQVRLFKTFLPPDHNAPTFRVFRQKNEYTEEIEFSTAYVLDKEDEGSEVYQFKGLRFEMNQALLRSVGKDFKLVYDPQDEKYFLISDKGIFSITKDKSFENPQKVTDKSILSRFQTEEIQIKLKSKTLEDHHQSE